MGNGYSIAREEEEEEEFLRLVEAVEIAQQRSVVEDDIEAGLHRANETMHGRNRSLSPGAPVCRSSGSSPSRDQRKVSTAAQEIVPPLCEVPRQSAARLGPVQERLPARIRVQETESEVSSAKGPQPLIVQPPSLPPFSVPLNPPGYSSILVSPPPPGFVPVAARAPAPVLGLAVTRSGNSQSPSLHSPCPSPIRSSSSSSWIDRRSSMDRSGHPGSYSESFSPPSPHSRHTTHSPSTLSRARFSRFPIRATSAERSGIPRTRSPYLLPQSPERRIRRARSFSERSHSWLEHSSIRDHERMPSMYSQINSSRSVRSSMGPLRSPSQEAQSSSTLPKNNRPRPCDAIPQPSQLPEDPMESSHRGRSRARRTPRRRITCSPELPGRCISSLSYGSLTSSHHSRASLTRTPPYSPSTRSRPTSLVLHTCSFDSEVPNAPSIPVNDPEEIAATGTSAPDASATSQNPPPLPDTTVPIGLFAQCSLKMALKIRKGPERASSSTVRAGRSATPGGVIGSRSPSPIATGSVSRADCKFPEDPPPKRKRGRMPGRVLVISRPSDVSTTPPRRYSRRHSASPASRSLARERMTTSSPDLSAQHNLPDRLLQPQERLLTPMEREMSSRDEPTADASQTRIHASGSRDSSPEDTGPRYHRLLAAHERSLEEHEKRTTLWYEQAMQLAKVIQGLEKQLSLMRSGAQSSTESLPMFHARGNEVRGLSRDDSGETNEKTLVMSDPPKPYPHRPYAAGFRALRRCSDEWRPAWKVFPLKAFRGSSYTYLKIQANWDDADLLREMSRSYDKLRTVWRKWFSLRGVRSITMVYADHTFIYPKRFGPAGVSPAKNMRLRYFLHHPELMKGRHEFMQVLTARTDLGIEFVEGWQLTRISVAILLPVVASLLLGVLYSLFVGDVSDAFTIAGYMTSAYSVCLVLLGLLNFVEF